MAFLITRAEKRHITNKEGNYVDVASREDIRGPECNLAS